MLAISQNDREQRAPSSNHHGNVLLQGKKGLNSVSWLMLPRKGQLFILFLSRLVDFLQIASLQAYMFFQLKQFDRLASDSHISHQAGILQGCFTGAQALTAILWGRAADSQCCGRKWVLAFGLVGTATSCVGLAFSTSFFWAAFWRAFGGASNGTVGVIRTMVAEIARNKKYLSRAFLILPMSFNVAIIIGPVIGGTLAEPVKTLPIIFGKSSILYYQWMETYPFALPSLVNAFLLFFTAGVVFMFLEETLKGRDRLPDAGLRMGYRIKQKFLPWYYAPVLTRAANDSSDMEEKTVQKPSLVAEPHRSLPFCRLWTRNVVFTLLTSAFYDFHMGAFANIWSLYLSTPRYVAPQSEESQSTMHERSLPMLFTGGLGMPASTVGIATSFLGIFGILVQVVLYPTIHARLGTLRSYCWFLPLFPIVYFLAPYLSILPSTAEPPNPASGFFVWSGIILILFVHVSARTVTLPASIILLNNCSPHPSVLGTIHGLGQSVSAGFRTIGPVVGSRWYGYGLDLGMTAWGWWGVAAVSVFTCATAMGMHEGSGHAILLDGEDVEETVSGGRT